MEDVTVCIPVYTRTEQLRRCLASIPDEFQVLVADDGHFEERVELYREHGVTMYYLGYDRGVGAKRRRLAAEVDTEYALFLDPDNRFPEGFERLYTFLRDNPEYGGVTGILDEFPGRERDTSAMLIDVGYALLRERCIKLGAPEFIGQAMLCRTGIFGTYTWDSQFKYTREHLDFFYGHAQAGEWRFKTLPDVTIPHVQLDSEYRETRDDGERKRPDRERFREKWGKRVVTV